MDTARDVSTLELVEAEDLWDMKSVDRNGLMEYVGWKNVQSAMRYMEVTDPFNRRRIESILLLA